MNEHHLPTDHDGWNTSGEIESFEARLKELVPRRDRLDREKLIFLAGRASVPRADRVLRGWSVAFGSVTTAAILLLALFIMKPENKTDSPARVAEEVIRSPVPPSKRPIKLNDTSFGSRFSQAARDVDDQSHGGRFNSITTRDVQLFADAELASGGHGRPGDQSTHWEQAEVQEEHRPLMPSALQQVFREL